MGQIYKHIDAVERDFIHRHPNEGCKLAEMTRSALFRRLRGTVTLTECGSGAGMERG